MKPEPSRRRVGVYHSLMLTRRPANDFDLDTVPNEIVQIAERLRPHKSQRKR